MKTRIDLITITIMGITIGMSNPSVAQITLTWTGSSPGGNNTVWEEPNNWDMGWVPNSDNNVIIPSGLTFYPNLTSGDQFCRNMVIQSGAQLNVGSLASPILHVGGSWRSDGAFNPGNSTVRLVETSSCTLSTETFYNLQDNKYIVTPFGIVSGVAIMTDNISILNDLTFEYGILETNGFDLNGIGGFNSLLLNNGQLRWGRETFTTSFETVNFDTGTVEFNRLGDQTVPVYNYHHLVLSRGGIKSLAGNIAVRGNLRVNSNVAFHIFGHRLDLTRDFFLQGAFLMEDESILTMKGGNIGVSSHAVFAAIGSGGLRTGPLITKHPTTTDYYSFNLSGDSSVISASHATFEYMDIMGVDIDSAAIVDPAHPLDHCRFQNGDPTSYSSALIHIDNNQEIMIPYADFPVMGTANVRKQVDYGRTTLVNATGIFAGPTYEVDFYGRIDWVHAIQPISPLVVIERAGSSTILTWNTVAEDSSGYPIDVDDYRVYSASSPLEPFLLETTVTPPDTTWTDTGILDANAIKFYRVTAMAY